VTRHALTLPERIEVDDTTFLRSFRLTDAAALARAVAESLEHLQPWMPWANEISTSVEFQRERLRALPAKREHGREWQYGLFERSGRRDHTRVLGSFGFVPRQGAGTLEIGYWVHADAAGRGHGTRAARAMTDVAVSADGIERVYICCDEANTRSAAIPRRLGYTLVEVLERAPEAPGESGRLMVWAIDAISP
jgi:RimJ/RimL family protein N-acetyltransferase